MKRLTILKSVGQEYGGIVSKGWVDIHPDLPYGDNSYEYKKELMHKVNAYEELEENKMLVTLPCKIGDRFTLDPEEYNLTECIVIGFECEEDSTWLVRYSSLEEIGESSYLSFEEFTKEAKLR